MCIKRDCKFYEWGGATPREYGAYCERFGSYFQKLEGDKCLPYCPECQFYEKGKVNAPILKVDCCGVVHDFLGSVHKVLKIYEPEMIRSEEPPRKKHYGLEKQYPQYDPQVLNYLVYNEYAEDIFCKEAILYEGVFDFMYDIYDKGEVIIRTHQPSCQISFYVQKLLSEESIPYDGFFSTTDSLSKNMIKNSILIDDKPSNIIGCNRSILIDRKYNRDFDHDNRAESYEEALEITNSMV